MTGFVIASLLIKESFDSWSESPVKTTVETLPIAEIKFPKLTVCPPKNTFTDLNYDLMMTENITLTEEIKDELFKYSLEIINEDSFSENKWTMLYEEDRFYNWYHGYTLIESPYYDDFFGQIYDIHTSAASGAVTTQYYGEQFRPELVERTLLYRVIVQPPESIWNNKNVTLHLKIEKVSMTGLASDSWDRVRIEYTDLDSGLTTANKNFTPPGYEGREIRLTRDVTSDEIETQKLDVMPGFRISWWYSGVKIIPQKHRQTERAREMTKQFVR